MGKAGFERLWSEAKDWARSPSKFFRNYSVDYFRLILGDGKEQMNAKKQRRIPILLSLHELILRK